MGYEAKIIKDSVSPDGYRLTTIQATYPRMVLAEFNTHRMFSRNSASSRAIPVVKQLRKVLTEPFVPERFGINQSGMQSYSFLSGMKHDEAVKHWLSARNRAVASALEELLGEQLYAKKIGRWVPNGERLLEWLGEHEKWLNDLTNGKLDDEDAELALNVHKQIANRLLEPFMWHTVIVTATEWSNFFGLRVDKEAQPEIFTVAELMLEAYRSSDPTPLNYGEWHLPYIRQDDLDQYGGDLGAEDLRKISAGRCARVSFLTQEGIRDLSADIKLHDRLSGNGHMSPLEHVAVPFSLQEWTVRWELISAVLGDQLISLKKRERIAKDLEFEGNFRGWYQHRKDFENEDDFSKIKAARAASA